MTADGPGDAEHRPDVPVVVLVSADWAGPSRPAPTLLRELAGRWGTALLTLRIDDPPDEILDLLEIEVLPTWLRFTRTRSGAEAGTLSVPCLHGRDAWGAELTLSGPWQLELRRTGALPKHVVDSAFGPARPDAPDGPRAAER